jgi:chromosome segregation ATPase
MASTEEVAYTSKTELLSGITEWVIRVRNELRAIPIYRKIETQQQELEEMLKQFSDLPNEYFSQEEAEKLKQKLEQMEEQLKQSLEQSIADKKELEEKVKSLHADMETLRQNLQVLKKRGWVNSLLVKAANWVKDPSNRELLKSGAEVAQSLLLEAGKNRPS